MKKVRKRYTREFRLEALRLLETSGRSASQLERDLGIGSGYLWRWKRKLAKMANTLFQVTGGSLLSKNVSDNQSERIRSCASNEIPKKAAAIFSHPKE